MPGTFPGGKATLERQERIRADVHRITNINMCDREFSYSGRELHYTPDNLNLHKIRKSTLTHFQPAL